MNLPTALTIAGSDTSAGAGMQADLKTMTALGVHGLTAITCLVSETPKHVTNIHPIPPAILQEQLKILLDSYPITAIKTGMLFSKAHIVAVSEMLEKVDIPIVVDPVMIASTGDPLLEEDAIDALLERFLPHATVLTPNLPEAGVILGRPVLDRDDQEKAVADIATKFHCSCYLKGGHLEDSDTHRDLLAHNGKIHAFEHPHLDLPSAHGTGCTLSAALAAAISKGEHLPTAAQTAHDFTINALKTSYQVGHLWHLNQRQ